MSEAWAAIQRNPISGKGDRAALIMELVQHLKQRGIRPRLFSNRERMQTYVEERTRDTPPVCIVAAGGDGTVQDVVNRYPDQRIAVLPLGTENLLARYLGIPKSGAFVAEMIKQGACREIDVCQLDQRKFVLMASIGFDAAVVENLSQVRKGNISYLSYLKPILRTLYDYPFESLLISIDDGAEEETAYHAIIVNIPAYGLNLNFSPDSVDHDGMLDLILFRRRGVFSMLLYLWQIVRGTHLTSKHVQKIQARSLRIQATRPVPIQTDGDSSGLTPAEIRVIPRGLKLIVPCPTPPIES
ncbi:diacylglycerol/lipid kinase family protein [Gimesia chilikensis]|uniref:diacylglycerol/lipid kinase family protein n=1 Tax=Gimesia chilikensis TaxID=2605989 RepID=UPI0011883128|nr:diacylglycerol kinase family protein [Gimesia chilikensis]QDT87143.1 Putative lipid kinase BmrU [Gimesia chilikensis]